MKTMTVNPERQFNVEVFMDVSEVEAGFTLFKPKRSFSLQLRFLHVPGTRSEVCGQGIDVSPGRRWPEHCPKEPQWSTNSLPGSFSWGPLVLTTKMTQTNYLDPLLWVCWLKDCPGKTRKISHAPFLIHDPNSIWVNSEAWFWLHRSLIRFFQGH